MIIDKSFEKYLLATLFLRFGTDFARSFEHHLASSRTAENPLQETLTAYRLRYNQIDNSSSLYIYLSSSPFIYNMMKEIYDCSPPNKLTVKSHLTMTLNVISELVSKDPEDSRIPTHLRDNSNLAQLKGYVESNRIINAREVRSIVN